LTFFPTPFIRFALHYSRGECATVERVEEKTASALQTR